MKISSKDVLDPEIRIHNPGYEIQYSKSRTRNPGSKIQILKSRIRNPGPEMMDPESRIRNPGYEIQNQKSGIQNPGSDRTSSYPAQDLFYDFELVNLGFWYGFPF